MIIAFCGPAGSGKDTSADHLVAEHGWAKIALADPMKRACRAIYPWMTREHLWGSSSHRNEPVKNYPRLHGPWIQGRCACCNVSIKEDPEKTQCYLTPRFALQQLGTEWGRNCYENTWIDLGCDIADRLMGKTGEYNVYYHYTPWDGLVATRARLYPPVSGVVISDLRWPKGNEGKAVHERGGKLLRLTRGEGLVGATGAHESELSMADMFDPVFDFLVDNREWTLEQLKTHLDGLSC